MGETRIDSWVVLGENPREGHLTTNLGIKVSNTDDSLKDNPRGPTLIEDFHSRDKITHSDHERIPERVVYAIGTSAHGYFGYLKPMKESTAARFLHGGVSDRHERKPASPPKINQDTKEY